MTSVRQSFVFAYEDSFGGGKGANMSWISPPPGSYFSSTATRQTQTLYATGAKKFEAVAYGQFAGTWEWTFMLDYEYLEPFAFIFDTVNDKVIGDAGWSAGATGGSIPANAREYKFKKVNAKRVRSFCVRRKILNEMAGGPTGSDEMDQLVGCVVQNMSIARSASTSQYQITLSGIYADESMVKGTMSATDYVESSGKLAEYSCMMLSDTDNFTDAVYVANTESISISMGNNVGAVYNTCTAFPKEYYEGNTSFQISTSCYSNNPSVYKQRMYSGGYNNSSLRPRAKGLTPLKKMFVVTYDKSYRDDAIGSGDDPQAAVYNASLNSVMFEITNVVIKSMKWQNGEGSKLVDSLSSTECQDIVLTIRNTKTDLIQHTCNSTTITSASATTKTITIPSGRLPGETTDRTTYAVKCVMPYAAPVMRYVKYTEDAAITSDEQAAFKALTKNCQVILDGTPTGSTNLTTFGENNLIRPLKTVTGLTITNAYSAIETGGNSMYHIEITGTPSESQTGYYLIVNMVTGDVGTLRIDVRQT